MVEGVQRAHFLLLMILRPRWIWILNLSEGKKWLFRDSCLLEISFTWPRPSGIFCRQILQNEFLSLGDIWNNRFLELNKSTFYKPRRPKILYWAWGPETSISLLHPSSILGRVKGRKWINSAKGPREPSRPRPRLILCC
jgi:hypothetical protein